MSNPTDPVPYNRPAEEQLRKAAIGELNPINSTISLVAYNPHWPALFEQAARRIHVALGPRALRIEHVGSTSVPGLAAKPTIDVLLVVANTTDEPAYVPDLETAGYVLRIREPDWNEHRMFKRPETDANLHCLSEGCPEIGRMLLFRDCLRENEEDRLLYERTKRELAVRTWRHVQNYADAKTAIVEAILARAKS